MEWEGRSGMVRIKVEQVGTLCADEIVRRGRSATVMVLSEYVVSDFDGGAYPAMPTDCGICSAAMRASQ